MENMTINFKIKNKFQKVSSSFEEVVRKGCEKRGFSQLNVVCNWGEIVGKELSQKTMPLRITFVKGSLGGTLHLGIQAVYGPELYLQSEIIKEKVNRVYGYSAIAKIKLVNVSEDQFSLETFYNGHCEKKINQVLEKKLQLDSKEGLERVKIENESLRDALIALGKFVAARRKFN